MKFAEMTWPRLARVDRDRTLVVLPIAAVEQHGRHLAVATDTILCGGVADRVEAAVKDRVLLLPVQWFGASDHHLPYGATLTASVDSHITMICEMLTPLLEDGYKRVLVLNGHGGNIDTMHVALRRLQPKFPSALLSAACYWDLAEPEIAEICTGPRKLVGHACEVETSMLMFFRPDLVVENDIKDDHEQAPAVLRGLYHCQDMGQRTVAGCVGYPEQASAEKGDKFVEAIVRRVVEVCRALTEHPIVEGRRNKHAV
ncbi:MAG: creatininase family protein [Planctomycetia bacterium]